MSCYFSAAQKCGHHFDTVSLSRVTSRTVHSTALDTTRSQAQEIAEERAKALSRGQRRFSSYLIEVPGRSLPGASDRDAHRSALAEREQQLRAREEKDLDEYQQARKVAALKEQEVQESLAAEKAREEETSSQRERGSQAAEEARAELKKTLCDKYGDSFLWSEQGEKLAKADLHKGKGIEEQLEAVIAEEARKMEYFKISNADLLPLPPQ